MVVARTKTGPVRAANSHGALEPEAVARPVSLQRRGWASASRKATPPVANVLSDEHRLRVLAALVDGNSIRAVERMTDVHRDTIMRFGVLVGTGAQRLHDRLARDLSCTLIEVDEQWGYVQKKQSRVDPLKDGPNVGEAWTWAALDSTSRLAITFHVGKRDAENAEAFTIDLRSRLCVMPQITSDGLSAYERPIAAHLGPGVDYEQVIKPVLFTARNIPATKRGVIVVDLGE